MGTTILDPALAEQMKQQNGAAASQMTLPNGVPVARAEVRPRYVFKIPDEYRAEANGITHIGMVKLTPDEELLCYDRAQNDQGRVSHELVKEAFRLVRTAQGDQPLSAFDASVDRMWKTLDPVLRTFVASAYSRTHTPKAEVVQRFLEAVEIEV